MRDNCLPIVGRNGDGPSYYCDYWANYCGGWPVTNQVTELESVWGGKLHDVIGQDDIPYIEFETAEQLTMFLLRWA